MSDKVGAVSVRPEGICFVFQTHHIEAERANAGVVAQNNAIKVLNNLARVVKPHSLLSNPVALNIACCLIALI